MLNGGLSIKFTQKQIDLFDKMFSINSEYTCYAAHSLTEKGLVQNKVDNYSYNTGQAEITLSSGEVYVIRYGETGDAEGYAEDAFLEFIEMDYDEEKFKKYLEKDTAFGPE